MQTTMGIRRQPAALYQLTVAGILVLALSLSREVCAEPVPSPAAVLIARIVPEQAGAFVCEVIPADNGHDVFEIEMSDGKIVLRGNSPLSQAMAFHWYLKYAGHCAVSLNGRQLALPATLPAVPKKIRRSAWADTRYFLNYCTFSYSMAWWDWPQWEQFIDWMAYETPAP